MDGGGQRQAGILRGAGRAAATPYVVAFFAQLVMAYVLAGMIGHLGQGQVTLRNGLISGAFIWGGFVFTALLVNHAFQGARRTLTLIDGGHWLGAVDPGRGHRLDGGVLKPPPAALVGGPPAAGKCPKSFDERGGCRSICWSPYCSSIQKDAWEE